MKITKKLFLAAVFFLSAFSIFALSDFSDSTLSVGLAFPYMKHDYQISGQNSVTLFGTGIDLNYRHQNDGFSYGLFLDSNIFVPAYKTVNISESESATKNFSDYDYFFGVDALAGVYKVIFSSEGCVVPAGIGLHLDGYTSKLSESGYSLKESVYTLGFGAWANYEVNVSDRFGVFAGVKVIYDFYYRMSASGSYGGNNSGRCNALTVVPSVGAAFHF